MTSIVERLLHQKEYWPPDDQALFVEAAVQIEKLLRENHELRRTRSEAEAVARSEGFKQGADDVVKQLRGQKLVVEVRQER